MLLCEGDQSLECSMLLEVVCFEGLDLSELAVRV